MKITMVHNRYAVAGRGSGEEVNVDLIFDLLKKNGNEVVNYSRSSFEIAGSKSGSIKALFSGVYNIFEAWRFFGFLNREKPDVVFVQNLYPLLSPSILVACKKYGVPVLMRVPNYRLLCPTGLMLRDGKSCSSCLGGKEYNCLIHNCEKSYLKSAGYALRGYVSNKMRFFKENVDCYLVLTNFAKNLLVENGFAKSKIHLLSGLASESSLNPVSSGEECFYGDYVGFVGRISAEKGVDLILKAAQLNPAIKYNIAGDYSGHEDVVASAPPNVEFKGRLDKSELESFYQNARFLIVSSTWFEGLPSVCLESMLFGKPIVCADIGGLSEVVIDEVTGLLFRSGCFQDLYKKVERLWLDQNLRQKLSEGARHNGLNYYSEKFFYQRLEAGIQLAIRNYKFGN